MPQQDSGQADTGFPDISRLMAAIDTTWPAAEIVRKGGWVLRRGAGGGKRVSAASGVGDIAEAELDMRAWGQVPLFRLTAADAALNADLEARAYRVVDPTVLYACRAAALIGDASHTGRSYVAECRPAMLDEIWRQGGIGPDRLAIMDRAAAPRIWLMSRVGDTGCGAAFVAVDDDVAMIHAIEVAKHYLLTLNKPKHYPSQNGLN